MKEQTYLWDLKNVKNYSSVDGYVAYLTQKRKDDPRSVIKLTREDLVSPFFTEALGKGLFNKAIQKQSVSFDCLDNDLFFSENEAMTLLKNYEQIRKQGGNLFFHEMIQGPGTFSHDKRYNLLDYKSELRTSRKITFSQMLSINKKLLEIAEKINKYSAEHNLSPFEKYLTCFNYVNDIQYSSSDDDSHSYTQTIQKNKGCCEGKSQYLRVLLKQCGINSCCIGTTLDKKDAFLGIPTLMKYWHYAPDLTNDWPDDVPRPDDGSKFTPFIMEKDELEKNLKKLNKLDKQELTDHAINLVEINDEKYGVHGVFAADTCGDFATGFMPIDGKQALQNTFNFDSYSYSSFDGGFEDFVAHVNDKQDLGKKDIKKIEREYFAFSSRAIKKQALDKVPTCLSPVAESQMKNLIRKIGTCRSFEQIKRAFDDKRFESTEFGKASEKTYNKVFSDEKSMLALTTQACKNRVALESCPLAIAIAGSELASSHKIADKACNELFPKDVEVSR